MNAPQVLIVEDDAILRGALCQTMEYGGYQVLNARNGKDALAVMDRETVDLVISDVRSHLQHMEALITSMLGFVKGHGKVTGHVGLEAALADAVQSCTADIENQQAAVTIKSCGPEPHLEGSYDDLVAAFSNLITNALDASATQPNITISSRIRNNRLAVIQISDRGCGIPAEAIDRIFDPFFTTRAAGNGVGLAVEIGRAHV